MRVCGSCYSACGVVGVLISDAAMEFARLCMDADAVKVLSCVHESAGVGSRHYVIPAMLCIFMVMCVLHEHCVHSL
jgi:hypothetical protein